MLDWFISLLQHASSQKRVVSLLNVLLQRITLHDISRRISNISKLKASLCKEVQLRFVEIVLDWFEEHAVLPLEQSGDIVRHLGGIFRNIELIVPAHVCMRVLTLINDLAYENNAEIRAKMKSAGLFDIRDSIIIHILCGGISSSATAYFVYNYQFQSIASQPKFRDQNNGVAYLLHIFLNSGEDPALSIATMFILRYVFGTIDENKRILLRLLEDPQVIERFFELPDPDEEHSCYHHRVSRMVAEDAELSGQLQPFVVWFFSDERSAARAEIAARVNKIIVPANAKHHAAAEKIMTKNARKVKERQEKLAKENMQIRSRIMEVQEQMDELLKEAASACTQVESSMSTGTSHRKGRGAVVWREMSASIRVLEVEEAAEESEPAEELECLRRDKRSRSEDPSAALHSIRRMRALGLNESQR